MEQSFTDAASTLAAARRRGRGREATTTLGAELKQDYANLLNDAEDVERASSSKQSGGIIAANGEEYISIESGVANEANEEKKREGRGRAKRGASTAGDVGLGDFGPDLGSDDDEPPLTKMTPMVGNEHSMLVRALARVRNVGLIGAALLFCAFVIGVGMVVWEEMQADASADEFRPDIPLDGMFVDRKTIAEEATIRGESAKDAMLDVEREMRGLRRAFS